MGFLEFLRTHALALPNLAKFAIGMALIVGIPPLARRGRLPAAVGLLLSGVLIGPHGLALFGGKAPIADFLADLGKLLLMFFAGLEIDLEQFRKARNRSILFGVITTSLPLILGTAVGLWFGYQLIPAIVIGSLLASHTLLGMQTVIRLGATRLEPITVSVGATVLSDTLSLVVFAICVSTYKSGFSMSGLTVQLVEIAVFVPVILFGLSRVGGYALKQVEDDENAHFVLMLAIMAVAGVIAQVINLPGIVGSFLAGLSVNATVRDKPAKEKLEFFGNSFFVPIFFVVTGFLIDPRLFTASIVDNFRLVAGIIGALLIGKWIAAAIASRAFAYTSAARFTMWSLTLPQVAATLAAALVGFDTFNAAGQRLLDVRTLNAVLVLMLTTSILGPVLTERFAPRLLAEAAPTATPKPAAAKS
ncbi:MAG TPA: cation:proton antiporter [Candidatus Binataceae bacterium]|jgi:Kef-type K+ transport system membrane component KefB|nr:cation:proton antiporter [Candidatus Binataceae bacterium]